MKLPLLNLKKVITKAATALSLLLATVLSAQAQSPVFVDEFSASSSFNQSEEAPDWRIQKYGLANDWGLYSFFGAGFNQANGGNYAMLYQSTNRRANAYAYTKGIPMQVGKIYKVEFMQKVSNATKAEQLQIIVQKSNELGDEETQIFQDINLRNTSYSKRVSEYFIPEEDGVYYVGFHCSSESNKGNLYIDDVRVLEETVALSGTFTVGSGGHFATLTEAVAELNRVGVFGPVTLSLINPSSQPYSAANGEAFPVVLNQIRGASAGKPITIKPAAGVQATISGSLILDGTDYLTIEGSNNGTTSRHLTLSTTGTNPAFVLQGDATYNTLRNTILQGDNPSDTGGLLEIGPGSFEGGSGNDFNVIQGNLFRNVGQNKPANFIYAAGELGSAPADNLTISGNEFVNFRSTGVFVGDVGNGSNWSISGNHFYNTLTATATQTAILFMPGPASTGNSINDNYIGGQARFANLVSGRAWTNTGPEAVNAIVVVAGKDPAASVPGTSIQRNTIKNISLPNQAEFNGIIINGGTAYVGTQGVNAINSISGASEENIIIINTAEPVEMGELTITVGQRVTFSQGLLTFNGNLTNGGYFEQTGGIIQVSGNLTTEGVFNQTDGVMKLIGGAQQVKGGTFANLEVNGSGTKDLKGDILITESLRMVKGLLNTGSNMVVLADQGVTGATLTETEESYITGNVKTSRLLAPGEPQLFGGIGLKVSGPGDPGRITVIRTTGVEVLTNNEKQGILRSLSIQTDRPAPNMDLAFSYLEHESNGLAKPSLSLFRAPLLAQPRTWANMGGTASPGQANTLELAAVELNHLWTIGGTPLPLPVRLVSFTAAKSGTDALLAWETASEKNSRGFDVEVSADGEHYRSLGFVPSKNGNSQTRQSYSFRDPESGKSGTRYYRLRQTDLDGTVAYSATRAVTFGELQARLTAFPNPFAGELTLTVQAAQPDRLHLTVTDALGRVVHQQESPVQKGANLVLLTLGEQHPAGLYLISARVGATVHQARVVKQK